MVDIHFDFERQVGMYCDIGFCKILWKFILWKWCTASFLHGSAHQFAPEMLFVAVKYILFLHFYSYNLFGKLQYDRISKHMINKMCFAFFSMIYNNVGKFLKRQ